jgi:hypothetical protein
MVLPPRSGIPVAAVPSPVPSVALGAQAVRTRLARTKILSTNENLFISSLSFVIETVVSDDGVQDIVPVSFVDISIDQLSNYGKRKRVILLGFFRVLKGVNDIIILEYYFGGMKWLPYFPAASGCKPFMRN